DGIRERNVTGVQTCALPILATPIATGAIKPKTAVTLAAMLNLVGAFLSTEVAKTISGGIIREGNGGVQITPDFILAGLIGAIIRSEEPRVGKEGGPGAPQVG